MPSNEEVEDDKDSYQLLSLDDEEAVPGVPPLEVVANACGEDESPLSEYEKLRERNIREREESMKHVMEEIDDAKRELNENTPGAAKRKMLSGKGGVKPKKKKVAEVTAPRRSSRQRRVVSYAEESDGGGTTTNKVSRKAVVTSSHNGEEFSSISSRSLRPRKAVNYAEEPEVADDKFIWCGKCNKMEFNGCERHPPLFSNLENTKLEMENRSVGRNAGDGIMNRGAVIAKGTIFGPYTGKYILAKDYEEIKKAKQESGYAWEIMDKDDKYPVAYIDPGTNPDPVKHWMAKINCPNKASQLNLVSFQLEGQIYYRSIKAIESNAELLVWYGGGYARDLGIEVEFFDRYEGKEDRKTEAVVCEYCNQACSSEQQLQFHLGKGGIDRFNCRVKQDREMIRMAQSGERKHIASVPRVVWSSPGMQILLITSKLFIST